MVLRVLVCVYIVTSCARVSVLSECANRKPNKTDGDQAQRDLIDALYKGGYLDLEMEDEDDLSKIDKEKRLGEFWFDYVYDGFFMKRSENAIPEAKRR